jgi:hypothetical protein
MPSRTSHRRVRSMRSMRSMRGGFIFRNRGPSLKVHHGQCLTSMTKHDSGGSNRGMPSRTSHRRVRSMRSMRGGFIFRSRGPWLKVHHSQCLTSMTKHDTGGSPQRVAPSWQNARFRFRMAELIRPISTERLLYQSQLLLPCSMDWSSNSGMPSRTSHTRQVARCFLELHHKWALRSRTDGLGTGQPSRKLRRPNLYQTVRTMATLSLFLRTSQQSVNLPLLTISVCTTHCVSVLHVFVSVCACSVTTSVLFLFLFTYVVCPFVYIPMCLRCILCSYICTALSLFLHSSFSYSFFTGHRLCFSNKLLNNLSQRGGACTRLHMRIASTFLTGVPIDWSSSILVPCANYMFVIHQQLTAHATGDESCLGSLWLD